MKGIRNWSIPSIRQYFRDSQNYRFAFFIGMVIFIYLAFFTSKLWLPDDSDTKKFTALDTVLTLEGRNITIRRWEYSPTQKRMEIELDVINNAYDHINEYTFTAVTNAYDRLSVSIVVSDQNFFVIALDNIPNDWKEISFRMSVAYPEEEAPEVPETLKMYTNAKDVATVDSLQPKTAMEYYKDQVYTTIAGYKEDIAEYEENIAALNEKIEAAQQDNTNLEAKIPLQAPTNAEESRKIIDNNNLQISSWQADIKSLELKIVDKGLLITDAENTLKNFENGD